MSSLLSTGFTPNACKTARDAQTRRPSTETPDPECKEDRRRSEWERRSWEEHSRRSALHRMDESIRLSVCLVNLALAMAKTGHKRVGILDLDIFGPSIPTLMGLNHREEPGLTNSKSSRSACFKELRIGRRRAGPIDEPWNPLHVYGLPPAPKRGLRRGRCGHCMAWSYGTESNTAAVV